MKGYFTYPDANGTAPAPARPRRIAVVTQGVKLGDETRGYTRFRFLSEMLANAGFEVDLITSTFQHWDKAQRDTTRPCYQNAPYAIRFIYEPGYKRNLDLSRIRSHRVLARNLRGFFESRFADSSRAYDLIYSEIPPNDMARVCAEVADAHNIPYVADINDLWPEAMRMVVDIPVVSDIAFGPFARDAKRVYELLDAGVGTSDEYADRAAADRTEPYQKLTVYVGNDLALFDNGAREHAADVSKPAGEFWVTYAGTLGASYDLETLVEASRIAAATDPRVRVKVLGDGPDRERLERLAADTQAPTDFVGYAEYGLMAAYLCASDVTINSLVKSAPQSIVTKIGDYLAAGIPLVNTGSSPEFRAKVEADGFGLNVEAEDAQALANCIVKLAADDALRADMGRKARAIAETQFDQRTSYQSIVELIDRLTR